MIRLTTAVAALVLSVGTQIGAAQTAGEQRQAYLGLIYHVRPAGIEKFVESNRQYSVALAAHGISASLLRWSMYEDDSSFSLLWLHPIEHLNDIEELSKLESQLDERIKAEKWNAGSDLHDAVDYTQEFVIRDEPALSRLPEDLEAWTHQNCQFRLYYTFGGYGGSDSQVRELWQKYLTAFPREENHSYYRILRVLIGLERPLWVVEHCGTSWRQIDEKQTEEARLTGAVGASIQHQLRTFVRKVEVWHYSFDPGMSYPLTSGSKAVR